MAPIKTESTLLMRQLGISDSIVYQIPKRLRLKAIMTLQQIVPQVEAAERVYYEAIFRAKRLAEEARAAVVNENEELRGHQFDYYRLKRKAFIGRVIGELRRNWERRRYDRLDMFFVLGIGYDVRDPPGLLNSDSCCIVNSVFQALRSLRIFEKIILGDEPLQRAMQEWYNSTATLPDLDDVRRELSEKFAPKDFGKLGFFPPSILLELVIDRLPALREAVRSHVRANSKESSERYITPILLFGDDDFSSAVTANKIRFDNFPRVLIFRFVRGFPLGESLFIPIPQIIRADSGHIYELRAIIDTAETEHAWAKGKRGDQWYEFDDETVHTIGEEDYLQVGDTSIVFYEYRLG